ncbi:NTP transferase domain-containing protein [Dokdonella immobilis]|uniref:Molybdenum cofactor guanylyltransferase n=1 Tax=Dokdonella immobilis TaxID=578942 RepID=A0A1I4V265_9GAMM|nr:NTP transferase domain-containing protein [Dokdonella immobilis]SFM95344.1 molybdenum cofactor guanylyltransferase [Dokdonella immobilis]
MTSSIGLARQEIATAILAGGASRRLGGVDKGLQPLLGRPLIEWVVDSLGRPKGGERLIVANRNAAIYARYGKVIADTEPDYPGPLAGIAAALAATRSPWLFTLPVDCPTPPQGLLDGFWRQACLHGYPSLVAHDGVRRQPLFALYRSSLSDSAALALRSGLGASAWQDAIGAREIVVSAGPESWVNLNTASDFEAFADKRA